jgi:RimJ/RimL family protein N-acetyltransferase
MIGLQKFDHADYQQLISWISTEELLMQFAGPGFIFPLTIEQLNTSLSDKNRHAFKIVDTKKESVIGHAEVYVTEQTAYLGKIHIHKDLRGMGIGQLIVRKLLDFAFTELGQSRVELNVFDWNVGAINCYQKVGFVFNPAKKTERTINGKVWTALNMVIQKPAA